MPAGGFIEPEPHGETPATKRRFRNLLEVSGLLSQLVPIEPREAGEDELLRFHTPEYLQRIRTLSDDNGGFADVQTPFGPGSYEIAKLAVGGCIEAVDAVIARDVQNAYALVRPPGHHAEPDLGRGFCMLGNVALAAMHAREVRGLERVAIVDFDVHHGNGTQRAFFDDRSVLTISVHQDNYYPTNSGGLEEIGSGAGAGFNINVPLPSGSGVGAYMATFERVVIPAIRAYEPGLVIVACGLDASVTDPFGRMMVHSDGYRQIVKLIADVASETCDGRLVLCHEGGYSSSYVPFCGLAVVEQLSGISTGVEDPYLESWLALAGQGLEPHQDDAVARAEARVSDLERRLAAGRNG